MHHHVSGAVSHPAPGDIGRRTPAVKTASESARGP